MADTKVDIPGGYPITPQLENPEYYSTQDICLPTDQTIKKTMTSANQELPDHNLEATKIRKIKPHILDQFTQSPEEKKENTFDEAAQGEIDKSHTIKPHNLNETADEEVEKKSLIPQDPHTEIQQVSDTSHREEERSAEQQHQLSTSDDDKLEQPPPPTPPQRPQQQPPQQITNITSYEDNNINKNENEPTSPDVTHPRGIEQSEQQLSPNNDNDLNILYLSKLYGSTENTEGAKQGGQILSKTKDKLNATIGTIKDKITKFVKTDKPKGKKSERSLSEEYIKSGERHQDLETESA